MNNKFRIRSGIALAVMLAGGASAADYTWGGGTSYWSDRTEIGWNGGPPAVGDIVRVKNGVLTCDHKDLMKGKFVYISNAGEIIVQDFQGAPALLSFDSGGKLTIKRDSHYNNYGALILPKELWVIGRNPSGATIQSTGDAAHNFLNLAESFTIKVFDLTNNDEPDMVVTAPLTDATDMASGMTWLPSNLTKEEAGTLLLSGVNTYNGSTQIKGGTLLVNGTIGSGPVTVGAGKLGGKGVIGGSVTSDGIVSPGDKIGKLTIKSGYAQHAGGTLLIELAGPGESGQNDVLQVDGNAELNGGLNVALANNFVPSAGQRFTILSATSVSGKFAHQQFPPLPAGLSWDVIFNPSSITLEVLAVAAP